MDNLPSKARKEIRIYDEVVSNNPKKILEILTKVFGNGTTASQVHKAFYKGNTWLMYL